jgi:hypothetical protein
VKAITSLSGTFNEKSIPDDRRWVNWLGNHHTDKGHHKPITDTFRVL